MAVLLKGAPAAEAIIQETAARAAALRTRGIVPCLAIVRAGERADDISYETGAVKKCTASGVAVKSVVLPADVSSGALLAALNALNRDPLVHGILLLRPLPEQADEQAALRLLAPEKDVDGCTAGSMAAVYANTGVGFAPCTAEAVLAVLDHYGIDPAGKRAVVLGRSTVVGRPVALLLMHRNATVTVCHTGTRDVASLAASADILVTATGRLENVTKAYLAPGQTVIDVGIGWSEKKRKLCGDVLFEDAEPLVSALTPVPGGVGAITSALLARHTVEAAERSIG